MKLQLPACVIKINGNVQLNELIFPCGTLYQHIPSGTYFRFMSRGGRWNKEYLITTDKGLFALGKFIRTIADGHIYTNPNKTELVKKLVTELEKSK